MQLSARLRSDEPARSLGDPRPFPPMPRGKQRSSVPARRSRPAAAVPRPSGTPLSLPPPPRPEMILGYSKYRGESTELADGAWELNSNSQPQFEGSNRSSFEIQTSNCEFGSSSRWYCYCWYQIDVLEISGGTLRSIEMERISAILQR